MFSDGSATNAQPRMMQQQMMMQPLNEQWGVLNSLQLSTLFLSETQVWSPQMAPAGAIWSQLGLGQKIGTPEESDDADDGDGRWGRWRYVSRPRICCWWCESYVIRTARWGLLWLPWCFQYRLCKEIGRSKRSVILAIYACTNFWVWEPCCDWDGWERSDGLRLPFVHASLSGGWYRSWTIFGKPTDLFPQEEDARNDDSDAWRSACCTTGVRSNQFPIVA